MLTRTQEDDRALCRSDRTQRSTALRMSVKLGYDHGTDTDGFLEGLGLGEASLSNAAVHDEDSRVRHDLLLHLDHLIEERLFLPVTAGCVHDDDLVVVLSEVGHAGLGNLDWIGLLLVAVEGALDLGGVHLELSEGTGAERVSTHNTDLPSLLHVVVGKLGASCRFTGTLETDKHDNIWFSTFELVCLDIRREHGSELVNDCFLDDST